MSYPIHVDCSGNQLTDLNTYVMQYTQDLDCSDNLFTRLDVRSCGMLETFSCQGNKLEKLDLSSMANAMPSASPPLGKAMSAMPWSGKKTVPPRTP